MADLPSGLSSIFLFRTECLEEEPQEPHPECGHCGPQGYQGLRTDSARELLRALSPVPLWPWGCGLAPASWLWAWRLGMTAVTARLDFTLGFPGVVSAAISGVIAPRARKDRCESPSLTDTLSMWPWPSPALRCHPFASGAGHLFLGTGISLNTDWGRTSCLWKALSGLALAMTFYTSMSSVPDPVSQHLNVLWGEGPTSLCLRVCGITCPRWYAPWSGLLRVTLELWASGIPVTELLDVSSSLGSTPSSIIKASGVLCASPIRLSSSPLSLILWSHWTTCKIQIWFSSHGTGRLQITSPNPLPVGLLWGLSLWH